MYLGKLLLCDMAIIVRHGRSSFMSLRSGEKEFSPVGALADKYHNILQIKDDLQHKYQQNIEEEGMLPI